LLYNHPIDESEDLLDPTAWQISPGLYHLNDVDFDVRGAVKLAGISELCMDSLDPDRVSISCGRRAAKIHVLQYCYFETSGGSLVGRYKLHYRNGETRELPIRYGEDLRNHWHGGVSDPENGLLNAKVVLEAKARSASLYGASLRLYMRTYLNPLPDQEIESIEFESTMDTPVSPVLVAMTLE
jgi:hypothetical protein